MRLYRRPPPPATRVMLHERGAGPPYRSEIERASKTTSPGASPALMALAFRTLARLGLLRWSLIRATARFDPCHQPVRPRTRACPSSAPLSRVIPMPSTMGNVTVAFGVLSYAGTLTLTV